MPSEFRIAIVGGGPAGLTLGVLLHKNSIPFTIFELRQKPTDKDLDQPAGSLDMHEGSGLDAIKACGLWEEFQRHIGDCSEASVVVTKHGERIFHNAGEDANRPEISRNKITKMLMAHVSEGSIKWGHKLMSATSSTTNGHIETTLDFGTQGKHTFDLVVGADGAWSKIRPLVTSEKPEYTGLQVMNLSIRLFSARYPELAKLCDKGTMMALGDKLGIATQPSMNDAVRVYIFITTPDEHFAATNGLNNMTPSEAKKFLLNEAKLFKSWGENLKQLIEVSCDDETAYNPAGKLDLKPLCKLPRGHAWSHNAGVTLIGDAGHLMNPPAGEGVNIAMQDSMLLAEAITKAIQSTSKGDSVEVQKALEPLLKGFERDMSVRAAQMADDTLEMNEIMFGSDDGARELKKFFVSVMGAPPPVAFE